MGTEITLFCRVGLHRYYTVRDCRSHDYAVCSRCSKRKVRIKMRGGYFPVDRDWVATGVWSPPPEPPRARASRA